MAYDSSYASICARVNSGLNVHLMMEHIGWYPEKIVRQGEIYRALCPIHREEVFRTLVLNPRNNTYHCEHQQCLGKHPADFLDLLSKVFDLTLPEVIKRMVDEFGAEQFRLSDRQVQTIERLAEEARAYRESLPRGE